MTYDLADHPLLDSTAKGLQTKQEDAFKAQVALAAELLKVDTLTFTGTDLVRVKRYLALQLNYQLKLLPDVFLKSQESSQASHQSVTYRNEIGLINPIAAQGVAALIGEESSDSLWEDIRSVRRNFL